MKFENLLRMMAVLVIRRGLGQSDLGATRWHGWHEGAAGDGFDSAYTRGSGGFMADETTPKTPAPDTAPEGSSGKPQISFDDFARLDLRVAKVLEATDHPNADKLIVLKLDDGSGKTRQLCAGVKGHYAAADLVGRSIVIVANLAPRTLRGVESQGMLLAASEPSNGDRRVVLLTPETDAAPGSVVS